MKRLLDINTWIALTLETHPQHGPAHSWYQSEALTRGDLTFCRQTEIGFLRLITQAAVMNQCGAAALSNSEAIEYLANVFQDPAVSHADEPTTTRGLWLELAAWPQPGPKLWMDAYLAAFAVTLDAELVTFDRGFASFQARGLKLRLLTQT